MTVGNDPALRWRFAVLHYGQAKPPGIMTVTTRQAQIFGALVAVFCVSSALMLEAGTAQYEMRCTQAGRTVTECKLLARGR